MGIAEKIAHAKKTSWVTEGISDAEVKTIVELAKISAQIEIEQADNHKCKIDLSLEGAFVSETGVEEENFKQLVMVNGAAAVVGIARGKSSGFPLSFLHPHFNIFLKIIYAVFISFNFLIH